VVAEPKNIFDEAALKAIARWRYTRASTAVSPSSESACRPSFVSTRQ
jgi:outer membrane biosynthesis protein TonB